MKIQYTKFNKFNNLLKLINKIKGFSINHINNINFICSFAILTENKKLNKNVSDKTKDIIYSAKLLIDELNLTKIENSLIRNDWCIKSTNINVIVVSTNYLKGIFDYTEPLKKEFILQNNYKTKIVLEQCDYNYFMSNLSVYLSKIRENKSLDSPIFIFQGLHLSTLISLFKQVGYTLHGGSLTLRHKLSSLEYNLAIFLYITELASLNKNLSYYTYIDSYISSNSVDKNLYDFFKSYDFNNGFEYENLNDLRLDHPVLLYWEEFPDLFIYIVRTMYFKLLEESNILENKKNLLVNEIKKLDSISKSVSEDSYNLELNNKLNNLKKVIGILQKEVSSQANLSSGHRANKNNKIKELSEQHKFLLKENSEYLKRKDNNSLKEENKKLQNIELEQNLKNLNENIDFLKDKEFKEFNTTSINLTSRNYKLLNKGKNFIKREYSTLLSNNSYKTKNLLNNNIKNINIRTITTSKNIINDRILEILYSNKSIEDIQRDIEYFLMNEQNIVNMSKARDNLSLNLPSNYPQELKEKILEASNSIITLHKNFLNSCKSNYGEVISLPKDSMDFVDKDSMDIIVDKDKIDKIIYVILSTVNIRDIIHNLFTIFFKIIKNNGDLNKETFATQNCFSLGKVIIERYIYQKLLNFNNNKNFNLNLYKKEYPNDFNFLQNSELVVTLGSLLIGWLITTKLLESKVGTSEKKEKRRYYLPAKNIKKYINNEIKFTPHNLPVKFPMVCKPKNYLGDNGEIQLGGYLLNNVNYIDELIIDNFELVKPSKVNTNNIIYKMVDNLNSVAFSINNEVLDFIINNNEKFSLYINPNYINPLEKKDKLNLYEKKELDSFNSLKNLELEILNIALILRNNSEIYMPVSLDYRGRVYCSTTYLNYQGIDLAKALLVFSKAEYVDIYNDEISVNYFKIYGANCFGLDKSSFRDRIDWINENEIEIVNFRNGNLISKAENKLLFIAFCFEYVKYITALNNNKDFYTNLPIQLDASCNGFQHLSLLIKENVLAERVNIGNTNDWKEKPEDFYSFLAVKTKDFLERELIVNSELSFEEKESYKRLTSVGFQNNRSLVKKTIMTIPYNATVFSNVDSMREDFKYDKLTESYVYEKDTKVILKYDDFYKLCKTLYKVLYSDFPKLYALLKYFNQIASIANKLNLPIPWNLPSGLEVEQRFYNYNKIKLKPFLYSKDLLTISVLDKTKFNDRKQRSALMPNLVHSLDATSLAMLVHKYFKTPENINFFAIHDCFAVTCNNVHLIVKYLQCIYCEIYCSKDFLVDFDINFRTLIKITYSGACTFKDNFEITIKDKNKKGKEIKIKYPEIPTTIIDKVELAEKIKKSSYIIK